MVLGTSTSCIMFANSFFLSFHILMVCFDEEKI